MMDYVSKIYKDDSLMESDFMIGDRIVTFTELPTSEIYGVGISQFDSRMAVVTHSHKTVQLYKYIAEAYTTPVDITDEFQDMLGGPWEKVASPCKLCVRDNVAALCFSNMTVELAGCSGSVALINYGVLNLYELLIKLCEDVGTNMLKYDVIWMFNSAVDFVTKIAFTDDSKPFRAKMFFDVGQERVGGASVSWIM